MRARPARNGGPGAARRRPARRRAGPSEGRRADRRQPQDDDHLRLAFDVASVGLAQADPHTGRWLRVNPRMCEITGYSEAELLALRVPDITHPEDRETDWLAFQRVVRGDAPSYHIEKRYVRKDRSLAWVSVNMTVLRDGKGRPTRSLGVIEDISGRKAAEDALRESRSRYQTLFENLLDGYAYCRMHRDEAGTPVDWTYLEVNPAFERLTGLRDVVGRRVSEVIPGLRATNPELFEQYGRVAAGGGPERHETYVAPLAIWFSIAVFSPANGDFVAVFDNVTERKNAEAALRESEERYRTVAEFTHDWEYWRAADGRFLYVSPACERLTGFSAAEFMADPDLMERITQPEDQALLDRHHAGAAQKDGRVSVDFRVVRRDGRQVWLNHSCLPVFDRDGRAVGRRGSNRDVEDRKHAEGEIRRLNQELEGQVRARTAELELANRELESFAYSVSHDLRSPLRGIDGWSLALIEDYGGRLGPQGRECLERVRSEAQRMGVLIDDLLRLSRVTRAPLEMDAVDLGALAGSVLERLRAADPAREVELTVEPGLTARGDRSLLEVALANLLGNAWKFSRGRRPAHIEFGRRRHGDQAHFFVRDDGVGFDMAYVHKLFGPFQRLHRFTEFEGTGVGLATVQRVVRRHGGRIWAEAEPDRGATFYFTLGEEQ